VSPFPNIDGIPKRTLMSMSRELIKAIVNPKDSMKRRIGAEMCYACGRFIRWSANRPLCKCGCNTARWCLFKRGRELHNRIPELLSGDT
jgi:hypothetical protein